MKNNNKSYRQKILEDIYHTIEDIYEIKKLLENLNAKNEYISRLPENNVIVTKYYNSLIFEPCYVNYHECNACIMSEGKVFYLVYNDLSVRQLYYGGQDDYYGYYSFEGTKYLYQAFLHYLDSKEEVIEEISKVKYIAKFIWNGFEKLFEPYLFIYIDIDKDKLCELITHYVEAENAWSAQMDKILSSKEE